MSEDCEENLLDELLLAADELEKLENNNGKTLKELNIFEQETNLAKKAKNVFKSSIVHTGETDSSDDEDNRNFEEKKYNNCGSNIKSLLSTKTHTSYSENSKSKSWKAKNLAPIPKAASKASSSEAKAKIDVYTDPVFGLRIVNPLISSATLQDRMTGREAIPFSRLERHLQFMTKDKDWVIAGVVTIKSPVRTSQKGSQYCVWTLSDLKDDLKTVSLFLFSGAHKQLWKTSEGTVVGILNPRHLERKDHSKDIACLSIDTAEKVMILGQSKDYGKCKSVKKNGEKCHAVVNLSNCQYCVYHIKQEYQKCSLRSELQANFAGKGLTALRNKVLGKNEVFYAGKSYMAIPVKKSKKLEQKDSNRLNYLNGKSNLVVNSNSYTKVNNKNVMDRKQNANRLDVSQAQRKRDFELLDKLNRSSDVTVENLKTTALSVVKKHKAKDAAVAKEDNGLKLGQFDLKSDLIVNVDKKSKFDGKVSDSVSLEESKLTALSVISKLKSKNSEKGKENEIKSRQAEENLVEKPDNDDFFSNEFILDYDEKSTDSNLVKTPKSDNEKRKDLSNNKKTDLNIVETQKINNPKQKDKTNFEKPTSNESKMIKSTPELTKINPTAFPAITGFPKLSGGNSKGFMDLDQPVIPRKTTKAKINAINLIKKIGPIKKVDPNNVKSTGKKRPFEDFNQTETSAKKSKLAESEFISDRFKKMMAATSKHEDLIEARENEEEEKYFNKLEMREQLEEKMATTFKVACKAVKCLKCKTTNFSASDLCKKERHPFKVFDAMKRFFKCGNCGHRTAILEIIPTKPCQKCGSVKWEKTGMGKEKIVQAKHCLSIRGGEQAFVNSVASNANLDLLVPDS